MKTQQGESTYDTNHNGNTMVAVHKITVTSSAFQNESNIPKRFSCQGDNISPSISWGGVPNGTKSFALVVEDPDAPSGTFIHWVIWNIPATETNLAENIPQSDSLPNGAKQGTNSAHKIGFMGPCPPAGNAHRYYFKLYALDTNLNLSNDATRDKLMSAIEGHILGEGEIMGRYQRS